MIKEENLSALRARVRAIIKDELALANVLEDAEGDFSFSYERLTYEVIFDPDDPSFIWIRGARRYELPDADCLPHADACINEVNRRCKLVKLYRMKPNQEGAHSVLATASLLVDSIDALSADTVERALFLIKIGKRDFCRLFEESAVEAPSFTELAGRAEPLH